MPAFVACFNPGSTYKHVESRPQGGGDPTWFST